MAEGQTDNIYTEIKCTKIQGQKRGMNVKGRKGEEGASPNAYT